MGTGRVDPRLVRGADKHGSKPFGGTSEGALNRLFSGTHAKMGRDNFAPSGSSFLLPRFWFLLPGNARRGHDSRKHLVWMTLGNQACLRQVRRAGVARAVHILPVDASRRNTRQWAGSACLPLDTLTRPAGRHSHSAAVV